MNIMKESKLVLPRDEEESEGIGGKNYNGSQIIFWG